MLRRAFALCAFAIITASYSRAQDALSGNHSGTDTSNPSISGSGTGSSASSYGPSTPYANGSNAGLTNGTEVTGTAAASATPSGFFAQYPQRPGATQNNNGNNSPTFNNSGTQSAAPSVPNMNNGVNQGVGGGTR